MRFSAPALGVLLAACGGLEPEDTELEPDPTIEDPNAPDVGVGRSIAELVSFSCATHTDVGYVNGNPYPITLITVEGQPMELQSAGVTLGENYPHPVVQHAQAREHTLKRYGAVKKSLQKE